MIAIVNYLRIVNDLSLAVKCRKCQFCFAVLHADVPYLFLLEKDVLHIK